MGKQQHIVIKEAKLKDVEKAFELVFKDANCDITGAIKMFNINHPKGKVKDFVKEVQRVNLLVGKLVTITEEEDYYVCDYKQDDFIASLDMNYV